MSVARVVLGSTVLLSIICANIPTSAIASGSMCQLSCCAGRAPHAAGSCMNGSCHAFLTAPTKTAHIRHQAPHEQAEELCGLRQLKTNIGRSLLMEPMVAGLDVGGHSLHSHGASKGATHEATVSTRAVTRPCQSDCGSCASGWTRSKRQRNAAALSYSNRPRPPSGSELVNIEYLPIRKRSVLGRRSAPRGPPYSFS